MRKKNLFVIIFVDLIPKEFTHRPRRNSSPMLFDDHVPEIK